MLIQHVLETLGIAKVAKPVFTAAESTLGNLQHHGLNARKAGFSGDLDHVVEFIIVALAGALHEPGIDLGAKGDFAHVFGYRSLLLRVGIATLEQRSLPI